VQRYYSGSADLLDEEFTHIFELTYNKFNDQQGVDTAPFRRSVWYYVHRIFGVIHDDYDYSLVNTYMNRRMKAFIKKVVCQPQLITIADIANLGYHLQPQEKCHLALLGSFPFTTYK
jgi:sestrin